MNTKKNYPYHVVFRRNEDLDGSNVETDRN